MITFVTDSCIFDEIDFVAINAKSYGTPAQLAYPCARFVFALFRIFSFTVLQKRNIAFTGFRANGIDILGYTSSDAL